MATSNPDELPDQFDIVHDGAVFIETVNGHHFLSSEKRASLSWTSLWRRLGS